MRFSAKATVAGMSFTVTTLSLSGPFHAAPEQGLSVLLISFVQIASDRTGAEFDSVFRLTPIDEGVSFDIDGDGEPEQVAWTSPASETYFLALDSNGNQSIDSGRELVGIQMDRGKRTGMEVLASLAPPDDRKMFQGVVSAQDRVFSRLLLWRDANHNGRSEPAELVPANQRLSGIGLAFVAFNRADTFGNKFRYQGYVEARLGGTEHRIQSETNSLRWMYDVVLNHR